MELRAVRSEPSCTLAVVFQSEDLQNRSEVREEDDGHFPLLRCALGEPRQVAWLRSLQKACKRKVVTACHRWRIATRKNLKTKVRCYVQRAWSAPCRYSSLQGLAAVLLLKRERFTSTSSLHRCRLQTITATEMLDRHLTEQFRSGSVGMVAIRIRKWPVPVQHRRTARDKVSGAHSHHFCPKCPVLDFLRALSRLLVGNRT